MWSVRHISVNVFGILFQDLKDMQLDKSWPSLTIVCLLKRNLNDVKYEVLLWNLQGFATIGGGDSRIEIDMLLCEI